jgi:hypothetical protein
MTHTEIPDGNNNSPESNIKDSREGKQTPTFDPIDPTITLNADFDIQYAGIDRKIVYKDCEVAHSQSKEERLKEKATRDWAYYSQKFEKESEVDPSQFGMLIYTTIDGVRTHIMVQEGENYTVTDLYYAYSAKDGMKYDKARTLLENKPGNAMREIGTFDIQMVPLYIKTVDYNVLSKF